MYGDRLDVHLPLMRFCILWHYVMAMNDVGEDLQSVGCSFDFRLYKRLVTLSSSCTYAALYQAV